jgi:signal transduction histidine kinase/ActR/RegA family two-component response regulator
MSGYRGRPREALITEIEFLRKEVEELRDSEVGKTVADLREAMQQVEAAALAKTRFLANMSHELRTPMTAILGCTELLLDEGEISKAPPQRIELLQALRRNGEHLTRIVTDILDLSKIEAGKLEVRLQPASLGEILQDISSIMGSAARERGLAFDLTLATQLPESFQTDATRVRQVLMNLIGNAIKFTPHGGVRLRVDLVADPAAIRFAVADTGCGMPPSKLEEIFEPFSQVDTSSTRRSGGTGLGLSISRELARLLGGDVTVESIEGRGSTFTLVLPIEVKAEELLEPAELLAFEVDPVTDDSMLLVEDGPDNRKLLGHTLTRAGFSVSFAENGVEAVRAVLERAPSEEPFDVILMDMQMPQMDGYEAARRLRECGIDAPIVALTAHAMAEERQRCLDAGCNDFATKPISRRTLIELVLRNLRAEGSTRTS